jgi:hypothetical protein
MRKQIYTLMVGAALLTSTTSCNDWLDLLPNNEQVSDDYWQSKEDVEAVLMSGYYYMRKAVPNMVYWGELRGGSFYTVASGAQNKIQSFDILATNSMVNYTTLYQVINMANSVLDYAMSVDDDTYYESQRLSHMCEAYFMRAFCYLTLVKNFKEVPLITKAYTTDKQDFNIPKSSEEEIIAQIKSDMEAALATGAAKTTYDNDWEIKGRVTKYALQALMADVCLWNHDYDECIQYCNELIDCPDAGIHPAFIQSTDHWFDIFYPGNSNESIFELNWDNTLGNNNKSNGFTGYFGFGSASNMVATQAAQRAMMAETSEVMANLGLTSAENGRIGRMLMASYVCGSSSDTYSKYTTASNYYLYKYKGTDVVDIANLRTANDANFVVYRMAEIMLMKAEALVMRNDNAEGWREALSLINQIRNRAGLGNYMSESAETLDLNLVDRKALLQEIIDQRQMEFLGEAKRWYDLLRVYRYGVADFDYESMAVTMVVEGTETTTSTRVETVLANPYAWYLPLPDDEVKTNRQLKQNPYYTTSN